MRYAAYIRYSHHEQSEGYSFDAQKRIIETFIKDQKGRLVEIYIDEAETARTVNNRDDFLRMRQDARKQRFDALVVAKFDRLNRNRMDAIAVKSLLRRDLGIKVLSATEPSEHDGAVGALIEGILECVAEWYSLNLSQEFKKGKRERALQGLHNNQAPFGYDKDAHGILIKNSYEHRGLLLAFEMYSTGQYSQVDIARELNQRGYKTKQGRIISSEMVRDMLRNRTYLGYVKYQPYAQHNDGRRSKGEPIEWHKGQHEAIISEEIFMLCETICNEKKMRRTYRPAYRDYLLRDLVYCWKCAHNAPEGEPNYGKMRAQTQGNTHAYYRCRAREFARTCTQRGVPFDVVEGQVISALLSLKLPDNWRENMIQTMGAAIGNQHLETRINEIKHIIETIDIRWDMGFITDKEKYLEQRIKLQQEIDALTPIPDDELVKAADIINNFSYHWQELEGDNKAQHKLVRLIVEKVYVDGNTVVAMVLRPNYFIPFD